MIVQKAILKVEFQFERKIALIFEIWLKADVVCHVYSSHQTEDRKEPMNHSSLFSPFFLI
jgi:hypothetical protein